MSKHDTWRNAFFRRDIAFPPPPASTHQVIFQTQEERLAAYLAVTETMSGQDLHHRFGLLGVLVDVSTFRNRHTALKKLVMLELKKSVLITEWAICELCGQRTYKHLKHCNLCKGIPEIRSLLPSDFEGKRHILAGYHHNGPFCLESSLMHELNPANGSMRQYLNLFVWTHQGPEKGPDPRPPCAECERLHHRQGIDRAHVEAIGDDKERTQELLRLHALQQKKLQSEQVCIGCRETYKKLTISEATGKDRLSKHAAFNTLRLCGPCLSAIQSLPEFGVMLQVLLDSSKERGLIKVSAQQ